MMKRFYLPLWGVIIFFFIGLGLCYWPGGHIALAGVLVLISTVLVFRKRTVVENVSASSGAVLSPLSGWVSSIRRGVSSSDNGNDWIEIHCILPFWFENGLYMPIEGEVMVEYTANHHQRVTIGPGTQNEMQMKVVSSCMWKRPHVWFRTGDRGRRCARFGLLPFGGTVLLYLRPTCELRIRIGDMIVAGQTELAFLSAE